MRIFLATTLALTLAACGSGTDNTDSADDFAARLNGESAPAADGNRAVAKKAGSQAHLPQAAANGRDAIRTDVMYTNAAFGGGERGLQLANDGTFSLREEDGTTLSGSYEWLPDGRRLRLKGVESNPIVIVADGALYRVMNEDVPLDDVGPERMYALPAQ